MSEKIRVLIVDDLPETRENVRKLLQFEQDMDVIGQAGNGEQAIAMAKEQSPDVVLMDINMPGVDGIGASQAITKAKPSVQIIIMSVQSESDYLRRAMLAGARDFLMKPFSGDELAMAIRRVYEQRPAVPAPSMHNMVPVNATGGGAVAAREGKLVTVYSPKGGNGCTTVAINVAATLARDGHRTILVDGSMQFGDVAFLLNMKPSATIIDLIERIADLDLDLLDSVALSHSNSLKVLLAPPRPEMAEYVSAEHMQTLLDFLRKAFEYVVIDTSSGLNELTLLILDTSDRIILLTQQNLPSIKNTRLFLDLTQDLEYEVDKIKLVVNRAVKRGVPIERIASTIKRPVVATIPTDDVAAAKSISDGVPFVLGRDQNRQVAVALTKLAEQLQEDMVSVDDGEEPPENVKSSRLTRLFGGR